jgi:hypothetical protein
MKIKHPAAESFIHSHGNLFTGKAITSFGTEYRIKELVYKEGEVLALLTMLDNPETPMILFMEVDRAAELLGIVVDWKQNGFK